MHEVMSEKPDGDVPLDTLICRPTAHAMTHAMKFLEVMTKSVQASIGVPRPQIKQENLAEAEARVLAASALPFQMQAEESLKRAFGQDYAEAEMRVLAMMRHQFRFPRSKRRRIRKKWAKNPANYRDHPAGIKDIELVIGDHDLYLAKAVEMFGVAIEDVTPEQRRAAKHQVFMARYVGTTTAKQRDHWKHYSNPPENWSV